VVLVNQVTRVETRRSVAEMRTLPEEILAVLGQIGDNVPLKMSAGVSLNLDSPLFTVFELLVCVEFGHAIAPRSRRTCPSYAGKARCPKPTTSIKI